MIAISVETNVAALTAQLNDLERRQLPFALAHALTMTARRVQDAEVREMREVFDRPKPYTLGSLFTKSATKSTLTSQVGIKADSPTERALSAEIEGGQRQAKPFEKVLRAAGLIPNGYFAVPGSAATMDAYGNMDRKQLGAILRYLDANKANVKKRARLARGSASRQGIAYFVGAPGGGELPLGIWQRIHFAHGSAIKPMVIFVPDAHYQRLFQFYRVAEQTIARDFEPQFRASLAEALATARAP
jgi:hypothetical protein